jgi:hypothetical protein
MSMVNDGLVAPLVFALPAASLNEPPETLTEPEPVKSWSGVNSTV